MPSSCLSSTCGYVTRASAAACLAFLVSISPAAPGLFPVTQTIPATEGMPRTGRHLVVFSLFQGGTAGDTDSGLLVYSEAARLEITNGAISHTIGTGEPVFGGALSPDKLRTDLDVYLQVSVGDARKVILPRERIESVPYAIQAGDADTLGGRAARDYMLLEDYQTERTKNILAVPGTGVGSTIGGGTFNNASGDYSTVGGGYANSASGRVSTIAGGQGNQATGDNSFIGGGFQNLAAYLSSVGGGIQNKAYNYSTVAGGYYNYADGLSSFIGGGAENLAHGERATVGGGWDNETTATYAAILGGRSNRAWGIAAVAAGGQNNTAGNNYSTIAGGYFNGANGSYSTVTGGLQNKAYGNYAHVGGGAINSAGGSYSAIAGGQFNSASGLRSTSTGGYSNLALGAYSTIPGGLSNEASGDYSFAAGRRAKADHEGSFVWADSQNADFSSELTNQFRVRAANGARFESTGGSAVKSETSHATGAGLWGIGTGSGGYGVYGTANGANAKGVAGASTAGHAGYFYGKVHVEGNLTVDGAINPPSDRAVKTAFTSIECRDILRRLLQVRIEKWKYRGDKQQATHIGPMSQDFAKAFEVGTDDKHIATVDADGVSLAAIQGLHAELVIRDERLAEQTAINASQQKVIEELKSRLDKLERAALD